MAQEKIKDGGLAVRAAAHVSDVVHFEAGGQGYYAVLRNGERLDIVRVHTFQPEISDYDDYYSFMFVQAETRFFILRQRVAEGRALNWECALELTPDEPHDFFKRACWEKGFLEKLATGVC